MSFYDHNPAGNPHLFLLLGESANVSLTTRKYGGDSRPSRTGHGRSNQAAIVLTFRSQRADENFALARVSACVSRLCSGTASGLFMRPAATRSSASAEPPCGLRFPSKSSSEKAPEKISPDPPQMQSFGTWEHGPLAQWCPDQDREIQQTETIMYQNKVTLIGFLGSNPEVRTNSNGSFTTLSLATKSSYKKDDQYISHTEWHRCVVFGKLSEFAKTLTKGAHIQVEGELRSREYASKKTDTKQRVWEIRVASILKLDRAEKAAPEDQAHNDSPQEEAAA
jgi:single-strand DNA-binding protein